MPNTRIVVFASHGQIYEVSASQMFHMPIEEITKRSILRQKVKIAELAHGYGGSVGALKTMGALEMGLKEKDLQPLVSAWRSANPNFVKLWWVVDCAAVSAVRDQTQTQTRGIGFECRNGMLFMKLPSARQLAYVRSRMDLNQFGNSAVVYEGEGTTKKWELIETYGPRLAENIVQAISRVLLAHVLQQLEDYEIVMLVHDEIVIEAIESIVEDYSAKMIENPQWAKDLSLQSDGFDWK